MKKENWLVIIAGVLVGVAALVLTKLGNPANMGFCIACFERDIAGAVGLHSAAKVQYVRPEIIGLVLGAFIMALAGKEFRPQAGSSPATRFVLGAFVMIGALVFLGCPLRMVLRMGGGDLNALVGLAGFVIGILIGIVFLKRGFGLKRSYPAKLVEGTTLPVVMFVLLVLVLAVPAIFHASEAGPGSMHAPAIVSLLIALVVGALAQKSRLCMVGGIRDSILVKDNHLLYGFIAIFLTDDGPQVLIVHSHGSEAYTMPAGQEYTPTGSFRTDNDACNVVRVGDEIAAALSERGISVLHDRTLHDVPDYNDAYPHSLASVEDYMEKYPSLVFVLDVHRDAVSDADGNQYKLVSAEEPHAAQMSFIMGNAYDGWQENLKLAIAIQQNLSADYPTLMRPITMLNYRYNQFVSPGAMLLEVGAAGNSLDEALYAARLFAQGFADTLQS